MPAPLDLTDRPFDDLTARRLEGRDKKGRRLWLCDCKCGGTAIVAAGNLLSGNTRSCGCRKKAAKPPIGKAAMRKGYAEKKRQLDGGRWWYAPRFAARCSQVTVTTLANWTEHCPWLDGRGLETRQLDGGNGRLFTYYAKDGGNGLDDIVSAKARRSPTPELPGHVHIEAAAADLGVSVFTLLKRMRNAEVKAKKAAGKDRPGRASRRAYVPASFIDQYAADQRKTPPPPGRITIREAMALLGVSRYVVYSLIGREELKSAETGRVLVKASDGEEYMRPGITLLKSEVEKLRDVRATGWCSVEARDRPTVVEQAMRGLLANGPVQAGEGVRKARALGLTYREIYIALKGLGVPRKREGVRGPYLWELPAPVGSHCCHAEAVPGCGGISSPPPVNNMVLTPARVFDISSTAAEKIAEAVERKTSAAAGNEEAPTGKGRGGRKPDPLTARLYEFCYIEYRIKGRPRSAVFVHARREFPAKPLQEECTVTTYANRHADNQEPPLPRRPAKNSP
jgi:hypothetical protein